jgi:hypothetical protein
MLSFVLFPSSGGDDLDIHTLLCSPNGATLEKKRQVKYRKKILR